MKQLARSLAVSMILATTAASIPTAAFAWGHGGKPTHAYKRVCTTWDWCGWGHNKHRCCKTWGWTGQCR